MLMKQNTKGEELKIEGGYLLLEQWHRPEDPLHLPERPFSDEQHFILKEDEVDKGGFPAEERFEILKDELSVSPVNADILNEFEREIS